MSAALEEPVSVTLSPAAFLKPLEVRTSGLNALIFTVFPFDNSGSMADLREGLRGHPVEQPSGAHALSMMIHHNKTTQTRLSVNLGYHDAKGILI